MERLFGRSHSMRRLRVVFGEEALDRDAGVDHECHDVSDRGSRRLQAPPNGVRENCGAASNARRTRSRWRWLQRQAALRFDRLILFVRS